VSVSLIAVGPAARTAWREALERDPDALVSQTPAWMDCVRDSGRYEDATRAYEAADGHLLVLPLARRRLPGVPGVAASMPFGWGTGGLISSRGRLTSADVRDVVAELVGQRMIAIGVRPSPLTAAAWSAALPDHLLRTQHLTQSISLIGGTDAVWSRAAATVRSHCRKAERRGVTLQRDDTGRHIPVFDSLYRMSVERWAREQHEPSWLARWRASRRDPEEKFRSVAARLGRACRVWTAWRAGSPVAAMVVLTHGRHSTMWRAAIDKDAVRGTGANELLHHAVIAEACEEGHRYLHLGDSAPGSKLARNKRGFGTVDMTYAGYRFERLPLTEADQFLRVQVKRAIGFRD
jgi:hypothetical protein